jgi:D-specific alpha-keto acid dehydrogenase
MERMTHSAPVRTANRSGRSPASSAGSTAAMLGITIYGCEPGEAALFRELAPRFCVRPTIIEAGVSEANAGLSSGNRCISVGHKSQIPHGTLRALRRAGVTYISTRSIGFDHIDVAYANSIGVDVGNVSYSSDSVADFAVMLMLMLIRSALPTLTRAAAHDYRLGDIRGRELRDLTIGIIGTGRIGIAVIDRLRGFGCRVLAYDRRPKTIAEYRPLAEVLHESDIVTLHTPLDAQTHHLLDHRRIAQMKRGAFIVNTGRGSLLDTEALIGAVESGRLGGAALDVLEGEEGIYYADRRDEPIESQLLLRLHELPSVIISPHTAYYTDHALRDIVENSMLNCLEIARGRRHG